MKQILLPTQPFLNAVLEYAKENNTEDAYQAVTQLLKQNTITLDQWHAAVHALYEE